MKRTPWLVIPVAILFTLAGVWFGQRSQKAPPLADPAVRSLFAQSMDDLTGRPQALAQWRGKTLLVNFWATWCPPCVQEMPELSALQAQQAGQSVQIIGIGIDTPANMREFSRKLPVGYPLYAGGMSATELSKQLGNQAGGLPFTVLIDADGKVRKTWRGRLDIAQVRRDIAALQSR